MFQTWQEQFLNYTSFGSQLAGFDGMTPSLRLWHPSLGSLRFYLVEYLHSCYFLDFVCLFGYPVAGFEPAPFGQFVMLFEVFVVFAVLLVVLLFARESEVVLLVAVVLLVLWRALSVLLWPMQWFVER